MDLRHSINYLDYVNEYWNLVYNYYSKEYVPYLCDYYNIDEEYSILDREVLNNGSYQLLGDKSGWRWKKINLLPVFFVEAIQNIPYSSDQRGVLLESETSVVIPGTYNFIPYEHDLIYFIESLSPSSNDDKPIWEVKTVEKDIISKVSFYKLTLSVLKYDDKLIENQISKEYVFVDYFKRIYEYDYAVELIDTLSDMLKVEEYIYNNMFDKNGLIDFNRG